MQNHAQFLRVYKGIWTTRPSSNSKISKFNTSLKIGQSIYIFFSHSNFAFSNYALKHRCYLKHFEKFHFFCFSILDHNSKNKPNFQKALRPKYHLTHHHQSSERPYYCVGSIPPPKKMLIKNKRHRKINTSYARNLNEHKSSRCVRSTCAHCHAFGTEIFIIIIIPTRESAVARRGQSINSELPPRPSHRAPSTSQKNSS